MKRFATFCLSASVLALSAVPLWSKGIFIQPGAREGGMGSAMTAIADQPTAVYYNPAGLAQKKDSGVQLSAFYLSNEAKSNRSLNNVPPGTAPNINNGDFPFGQQLPPGVEPSEFHSRTFKTEALIPFVGGYHRAGDITYALSVYGIAGGGGKWSDSVSDALTGTDTINASIDASYAFIIYNFSAAKEFTRKLSLGAGIDIVNMIDNLNVQKGYTLGTGSVMPASAGYGIALDKNAAGYGVQFNLGALYKLSEKVKGGLVFRSGTNIKLKGKATLNGNRSDYDEDYTYPLTCGLGLSYEPGAECTLALAIDKNNYSAMHETVKYKSYIGLQDIAEPLNGRNWIDTTQLRLGAEYRCTQKLSLRAGIQNDPVPFSTDQLTLTEINQYDFIYYSIGAGYKIGNITLDACYAYCPSDKPSVGGRTYEYPLDVFRLGADYAF